MKCAKLGLYNSSFLGRLEVGIFDLLLHISFSWVDFKFHLWYSATWDVSSCILHFLNNNKSQLARVICYLIYFKNVSIPLFNKQKTGKWNYRIKNIDLSMFDFQWFTKPLDTIYICLNLKNKTKKQTNILTQINNHIYINYNYKSYQYFYIDC